MSILAATSIYAGILMFHQDSIAGIAGVLLGVILLINPLLFAIRHLGASVGDDIRGAKSSGSPQKKSPKKNHLKLVRPQDEERPTIH
jgi:hypothetical protein